MGSRHESTTVFDYTWNQVVRAFWNRYPNPASKHVLTEDTIKRDVRDGKLYTRRILSKTNPLPKWGERFYSAKSVRIVEDSELDPKRKRLRTFTRNIGFNKIMSVDETVEYTEENGKTVAKRSAFITSSVFGFSRAIRAFGVERFKSNINKTANGFNFILAKMFPHHLSLDSVNLHHHSHALALTGLSSDHKPAKLERLKNATKSIYNFSKAQAIKLTQMFSVKN